MAQAYARRYRWRRRADHDGGYHLLFGHPRVLADLLSGFIDEPWVDLIDLDSLERVNAKLHAHLLLRCDGDMIWRVRLRSGGFAYIYVVIEFQSKPDRWMAVRMAAAVVLLYLHLIRESVSKQGRSEPLIDGGTLPLVFPLVVFNGARKWNAVTYKATITVAGRQQIGLPIGSGPGLFNAQSRLLDERSLLRSKAFPHVACASLAMLRVRRTG